MNKIITLLTILLCSCEAAENPFDPESVDITPPTLYSVKAISTNEVEVLLSEPCTLNNERFLSDSGLTLSSQMTREKKLILTFMEPLYPGMLYKAEMAFTDARNNSLSVIALFYGYNPDLPELLINEFTTEGSSSNPDKAELYVLKGGNTAGITLYSGNASSWDNRVILPPLKVNTGDYIVIHSGLAPGEIFFETESQDEFNHKNATPAWDFYMEKEKGFPGENGVLTLYTDPYGEMMDAVIYSTRTYEPGDEYNGFGTRKTFERAEQVWLTHQWQTEKESLYPEECINPKDSSATRSLCRNNNSDDSNLKSDWHIVPRGQSTFGKKNSEEIYSP